MTAYVDGQKALEAEVRERMEKLFLVAVKGLLAQGLTPEEALSRLEHDLNELDEDHTWTCTMEYHQ